MEKKASGLIEKSLKENSIKFLGEGTESNPFLISDVEGFNGIRNNLSAFYRLTADIDFGGATVEPVGTQSTPFGGGLDGDGHAVRNFKIGRAVSYTGLFGSARAAKFRNLSLEDAEVTQTSTGSYTGVLSGYLEDCIVENTRLCGVTVSGKNYSGALAGDVLRGSVAGCCAAGGITVTGDSYVGGLLGGVRSGASVSDSYAMGSVASTRSNNYVGGLVGSLESSSIRNSYAACSISGGWSGLAYVSRGQVENSWYDSLKAGFGTTDGYNAGKLTTALVRKRLYEGWDFENVWDIEEGSSYPYLRGMEKPDAVMADVGQKVSGGIGTEEDPYLLNNAAGFDYLRYDLKGYYRLTADIDFGGATVEPVGTQYTPFGGGLDGDGHAIRNFKIGRAVSYTGLFGSARAAKFRNLSLEDAEVTQTSTGTYTGVLSGYLEDCIVENTRLCGVTVSGKDYSGALAGDVLRGSVAGCCAAGGITVTGDRYVGGLLGRARSGGTVSDSYAMGTVTSTRSDNYVGGLVGYLESSSIRNSYAACRVSGNGKGLVHVSRGQVEDSWYDSLKAGFGTTNEYNVGKLTTALVRKRFYEGWDFENVWDIEEGGSYPYLRGMEKPDAVMADVGQKVSGGTGTEEDPYLLNNAAGFDYLRYDLKGFYRLTADIDFGGATVEPVGTPSMPFGGGLDGDGYAVRNFRVSRTAAYTGLFGSARAAKFRNLSLEDAEVAQTSTQYYEGLYTGALSGYLEDCAVENIRLCGVTVSGKDYSGALAGDVLRGSVAGCCAAGGITVTGDRYVGGLLGRARSGGTVSDSYAMGTVTSTRSDNYVGGLVGYLESSSIRNSYAACRVSGNGRGLAYAYNGQVEDSWYDSLKAGFGTTDGYNAGKLTTALVRKRFYEGWDFENVWNIEEGSSYPYLRGMEKPDAVMADVGQKVSGGTGTEEDPYLLNNAAGFDYFRYDLKGFYRLTADIDFGGATVEPVGTPSMPFGGGLDGDGYAVRNFRVSRTAAYTGLFGSARAAKFRNLSLENAEVAQTSTEFYMGALAGYLEDCAVENIRLCGVTVSGKNYSGTLAGGALRGSITGCCATGNITVVGSSNVGGILGDASGSAKISECCMTGSVTGTFYIGGLVGNARQNTVVSSCYSIGSVSSTNNDNYVGGLIGYAASAVIRNSYAACRISGRGSGLAYLSSSQVENSYFDSNLSEKTTPEAQARTTEQMISKDTYIGWDWDDIWSYETASYPVLKNIEAIKQEPFELSFRKLTSHSAIIEWPDIPRARSYDILYQDKIVSLDASEILIENLAFDTEYEFRVRAEISDTTRVWSKTLRLRTKKLLYIEGLHSTEKTQNSLTLTWKQQDNAESYEVIYNGNVQRSSTNACTITGLNADVPYLIRVNALITDGSIITSSPIVEKLYDLSPQTDYAREFIGKCENQTWFIDEIEKLLNLQGKSVNTIDSKADLSAIYAIGLTNSGISGRIPAAIGELYGLRYLYLANNELSGAVPDELGLLEHLIEADLTGNDFPN